jgi:hypothetical protein
VAAVRGPRRHAISTPGERGDPARRGPASVFISLALHLVAIAILVRVAAVVPMHWNDVLQPPPGPQATHVDYVRAAVDSARRQRAGGDNRRATNNPAPAAIVAPSEVPSALPPEPARTATPAAPAEGGSGPVIGGGGPTRGMVPQFTDPRLWAPTEPAAVRPRTPTERLDSAIAMRVHHLEDSLNALGPQRAPGDWSWKGKDGKKYGIDQKYIRLGPFSIPTALLALLPLNVQGNPTAYENARHFGAIRAEILEQGARAARDEEFNQAVKDLRDRRQKERAAKVKADQTLPEAPPPVKIIP